MGADRARTPDPGSAGPPQAVGVSVAYLALGSNIGDRLAIVQQAVRRLNDAPDLRVTAMSTIFETEPVGGPPQGRFLNCVVEARTALAPQPLLARLQLIETALGRAPSRVRWGPRVIDLDILLYDDRVVNEPHLTIPHPRLHERRFMLEPLAQLAPDLIHPALRRTIAELLYEARV